jgi:hypothetical protein
MALVAENLSVEERDHFRTRVEKKDGTIDPEKLYTFNAPGQETLILSGKQLLS